MAYIDDLKTARDNLATAYKNATSSPKPNYSVDGQSVSWADYLRMLAEQLTAVNEAIASGEPFEHVTSLY